MKKGQQVMRASVIAAIILGVVLAGAIVVYADVAPSRGTHTADEIVVNFQGSDTTLHDVIDKLNTMIATATQGIPPGFIETPTNLDEDVYGVVTAVASTTKDTCDSSKGKFFSDVASKGIQDYGRFVCPTTKETIATGCDDVFLTSLYVNSGGRLTVSPQYAARKVFCKKAFSLVKTTAIAS